MAHFEAGVVSWQNRMCFLYEIKVNDATTLKTPLSFEALLNKAKRLRCKTSDHTTFIPVLFVYTMQHSLFRCQQWIYLWWKNFQHIFRRYLLSGLGRWNIYIFQYVCLNLGVRCPKKRGVQIKQVFKWYKTVKNKTGLSKTVRFSQVSDLSRCPVLRFHCNCNCWFCQFLVRYIRQMWLVPQTKCF